MVVERNPDLTRQRILQAAYEDMHRHGFQGLRVDQVLAKTGLTKGAFYHHFSSKKALALAIIEEVVAEKIRQDWIVPLTQAEDPVRGLIGICYQAIEEHTPEELACGCPLHNIAQEMSAIDEDFRHRIEQVYLQWVEALSGAVERGKQAGRLRTEINARQVALFFIASLQGVLGLAKCSQCVDSLQNMANCLADYLNSLYAHPFSDAGIPQAAAIKKEPATKNNTAVKKDVSAEA